MTERPESPYAAAERERRNKEREEKANRLKLLDGFAEGLKPMSQLSGQHSTPEQIGAALGSFARGLLPLLAELRKDMADD